MLIGILHLIQGSGRGLRFRTIRRIGMPDGIAIRLNSVDNLGFAAYQG